MENENRANLLRVHEALQEKGYNPIGQIVGYLLTEDPTYITNHLGARNLIRKIDRISFGKSTDIVCWLILWPHILTIPRGKAAGDRLQDRQNAQFRSSRAPCIGVDRKAGAFPSLGKPP